jgi:hypothetical protein
VYITARYLVRRLTSAWARRVETTCLLLFAAGCAVLCFGALSAPFHHACVDPVPVSSECESYGLRPGADLAGAAWWAALGAVALAIAGVELRVIDPTRWRSG